MEISIGIITYNDVQNVRDLVQSFSEPCPGHSVREIILVSTSECMKLVDLAQELEKKFPTFSFFLQSQRQGKSSAINLFLRESSSDVVVVCSGDVHPAPDALSNMLSKFDDPCVGMVGPKIISVRRGQSLAAKIDAMIWRLHDVMASFRPKLGEMVAFRRVFDGIPEKTMVDEAYIEHVVCAEGYSLAYAETAVVYNCPERGMLDFLRKRVRINLGHIYLFADYGYEVSSLSTKILLRTFFTSFCRASLKEKVYLFFLGGLEVLSRATAGLLFMLRYCNPVWHVPEHKEDNANIKQTEISCEQEVR